MTDYIRTTRVIADEGVAESLGSYDSSGDGLKVSTAKHWLALISAQSAPLSPQFNFSGLDPYPNDMDDGLVPISAQYSAGADVVYYGEHAHGEFEDNPELSKTLADQILRYIFGDTVMTSVPGTPGTFEHRAALLPITYHWDDVLGESVGTSGVISHTNMSLARWQQWHDLVGACAPGAFSSSFRVRVTSPPFLTGVRQAEWRDVGDPTDCGVNVESWAAPKTTVVVHSTVFQHTPLPQGVNRDHYEIRIIDGTSLVGVTQASWMTGNSADFRLSVASQAEGPFHWFSAEFRIYYQKATQRKVIEEISPQRPAS